MGTYIGRVSEDGSLRIYNKELFLEEARKMSGMDVELVLRKREKAVSGKQRGYLHAVVIPELVDAFYNMGYNWNKKQVYEWVKANFLYRESPTAHGEIIKIPLDLSDKSDTLASEITKGLEALKIWAAENLEHYIPDAGEQKEIFDTKDK